MQDPNVMFSLSGKKNVCYFEAGIPNVQFASVNTDDASATTVPALVLEYTLAELAVVTQLFAEMDRKNRRPVIYAWDLENDEPELLIEFRTTNPNRAKVSRIVGKRYSSILETTPRWHTLMTGVAANMPREDTLRFLEQFKVTQRAVILIFEAGAPKVGTISTMEFEPVHTFDCTKLHLRKAPTLDT